MRTILVTGAAGFIGSHVSEALIRRGDRAIGLDVIDDYYDPAIKKGNLEEIARAANGSRLWELVAGDVRDGRMLQSLFASHKIDTIIHLGARAGVRPSIAQPLLYLDVNLIGTAVLLEEAVRAKVPHFVLASTSSVYGDTKTIPFVESDPCDRPLAPYAASKRAAEMLGYTFRNLHPISVTVLRFFTVYGPRNRPDMMAYRLLDSMFSEREVPLYGDGNMWRDWTFVDDVVEGVLAAADKPLGYEVLNLGRGEPIHLLDFVRRLEQLTGKRARVRPEPRPETDVERTWADVSKTQRLLGYAPRTSVDEGTAALWRWFEQKGKAR